MDNRAKAWLGGLAGFLFLTLVAAFLIGGKEKVDLLTLETDGEVAAGLDDFGSTGIGEPGDVIIDGVTSDGNFVTSTVPAVATVVTFATSTPFPTPSPLPTSTPTPIPTLVADPAVAADATAVPAEADPTPTVASLAGEATVQPTATGTDVGAEPTATVFGIATPTPLGATPIPAPTPSGPGSFRVGAFEAEGATVTVNTMSVKVNEDGTGTAKGALSVSWPDGRTAVLKVDDAFNYNTAYEGISVGVNAEYKLDSPNDADDIEELRGTMRIPKPLLRVGSICSRVCFTFDY